MKILLGIILFTSIVAIEGCLKEDTKGRKYADNYLWKKWVDPQDTQDDKWFIDPRWPDGIIPYKFSAAYSPEQKILIGRAMLDIQRQTCIRFVPRETQEDYIYFNKAKPNYSISNVGRIGGHQLVNLDDCMQHGIILHELMHVMGFIHEHQRPDRDKYVSIEGENILEDDENYVKVTGYSIDPFPYDYESITHFSRNQGVIPVVIDLKIGEQYILSELDVQGIKWLYNCRRKQPPPPNSDDVDPYFCPKLVNHYQRCEIDIEEGCKRSCDNFSTFLRGGSADSQDTIGGCIHIKMLGLCNITELAREICFKTRHFCTYLV